MIFIQLVQVLLSRPKRGKTFWAIVAYSGILFPLTTVAIGGLLKFTEMTYIDSNNVEGPMRYRVVHASEPVNMMGQIRYVWVQTARQ
jgi:hypothetical protein